MLIYEKYVNGKFESYEDFSKNFKINKLKDLIFLMM